MQPTQHDQAHDRALGQQPENPQRRPVREQPQLARRLLLTGRDHGDRQQDAHHEDDQSGQRGALPLALNLKPDQMSSRQVRGT